MSEPNTSKGAKKGTAVGRAATQAKGKKNPNEKVGDFKQPCRVELILTIQRIKEWPKNPNAKDLNAQQGGTIGEFDLRIANENVPLVTGYMLEAAGPSSQEADSDQRILAGTYSLIKSPGAKPHPYRLVQTSQAAANATLGNRTCCNIHKGSKPTHLEGCICPGPTWKELGVITRKGVEDRTNVYPSLESYDSSGTKLNEIIKQIDKYGEIKSKTTYDGKSISYGKSSWYSNVTVIIREIRPIYVYFAIAYIVQDKAFERAAKTWEHEVKRQSGFLDGKDVFMPVMLVKTEREFEAAWQKVLDEGKKSYHVIKEGRIFSHATKGYETDGLSFAPDPDTDGTTDIIELSKLPVLNWAEGATLHLHGCNSGVTGKRGWAPAGVLANSQNVKVIGQSGFAYFSASPNIYVESNKNTFPLYLWAFRRGWRNTDWLEIGSGAAMPSVEFDPPK